MVQPVHWVSCVAVWWWHYQMPAESGSGFDAGYRGFRPRRQWLSIISQCPVCLLRLSHSMRGRCNPGHRLGGSRTHRTSTDVRWWTSTVSNPEELAQTKWSLVNNLVGWQNMREATVKVTHCFSLLLRCWNQLEFFPSSGKWHRHARHSEACSCLRGLLEGKQVLSTCYAPCALKCYHTFCFVCKILRLFKWLKISLSIKFSLSIVWHRPYEGVEYYSRQYKKKNISPLLSSLLSTFCFCGFACCGHEMKMEPQVTHPSDPVFT